MKYKTKYRYTSDLPTLNWGKNHQRLPTSHSDDIDTRRCSGEWINQISHYSYVIKWFHRTWKAESKGSFHSRSIQSDCLETIRHIETYLNSLKTQPHKSTILYAVNETIWNILYSHFWNNIHKITIKCLADKTQTKLFFLFVAVSIFSIFSGQGSEHFWHLFLSCYFKTTSATVHI